MRRFITNIWSELKGQQLELSSLKEDVRENCLSVSSDVKKLKIQRDQFGNTREIKYSTEDIVKQIPWDLDKSKFEHF